ncbi:NADH-quinone oxidoreductase subunit 4 [mine drainage metagenome]|uniref:NADH-quinone oxidoreductase subunit 4 n=1 Tax=mine drainage metagenome TaxID=410659 RepID=A0A1J5PU80_9ZZZZ
MKRTFGLGLARAASDHPIDLGYSHPSSHGGLRIHCEIQDERITSAQIEIGFMHRGVEDLFAERDYRQGVMLASRHDWSGSSGGELAYALAIEDLLGLIVPIRASWIRVLICELDRILSALTFLGALPEPESALARAVMNAQREKFAFALEKMTGARMHHQIIRVGGVGVDVDDFTLTELEALLAETDKELDPWDETLATSLQGYRGVGILDHEVALSYGASGIVARASGLMQDVRVTEPYATYGDIEYLKDRPTQLEGDIPARVASLLNEIKLSIQIIASASEHLKKSTGQPISERTPKVLRLPEGEAFRNVEGALGTSGVALFSDGGRSPLRLRLRTASWGNLSALEPTLVGVAANDLPMLLASWPFLSGDSDR